MKLKKFEKLNINKTLSKARNLHPNYLLGKIFGMFSHDIGIDLGTANTLVWVKGKGIVIREPSVVARQKKRGEILAIGTAAKSMLGKEPGTIEVVRPLKDGVIADFDAASKMLEHYIKKVHESGSVIPKIPRPRVVVGIPSGVTEVERRAVADATINAGGREAHLIEEPMAAAIGLGLKVDGSKGIMVVDIGGGTTEMAVISLGGIVTGRSIRVAGDEMTEAVVNYIRLKYSMLLGESTAENVKIALGTCNAQKEKFTVVRGRDLEKGLPKSLKVSNFEVQEALSPTLHEIVGNIVDLLEETPPELVSDIMESGIYLAGGGSLIEGISDMLKNETKISINISDDPMSSVVRGCGIALEDPMLLKKIKLSRGL